MASRSEELYCSCRKPNDSTRFMIQCEGCWMWFHGGCVGITERQAEDVDKYYCTACEANYGPSILRKRRNADECTGEGRGTGPSAIQSGSAAFINQLKHRKFLSTEDVVLKMKGHQLTVEYLEKNGFKVPILVDDSAGLDLIVPSSSFTVKDVEQHVGGEREIDVIDVAQQADMKMHLHEWAEYFVSKNRTKVLNVISLEFSDTGLSKLVSLPRIVTELSWVNNCWPSQTVDDYGASPLHKKPEVQKYCLMSVKDSYTDFHIDFGGTSVWYHVLWGEKVFYLIEPSTENLSAFEAWASSPNQNEVFFADRVNQCYKLELKGGQTLFIPTGWIHAVYTPTDSLVFGGNFLHSLNAGLQMRVYELEKRIETPDRFRFPNFETTCWYAARHVADTLRELVEESRKPPQYLCRTAGELLTELKSWTQTKDLALKRQHKDAVPEGFQSGRVLRDLVDVMNIIAQSAGTRKAKEAATSKKKKQYAGGPARRDKLSLDLDVLEQHTHQALRGSGEPVTLKMKMPKAEEARLHFPTADSPSGVGYDNRGEDSVDGSTADEGGTMFGNTRPNALKLKFHLADTQPARFADDWDVTKGEGGCKSQTPLSNQRQAGRQKASVRRQMSADGACATRAYTRDDYVYPSLADSDGEDSGAAFTKVKGRTGKKRLLQDDTWYPSVKVRTALRTESGQADASLTSHNIMSRPIRASSASHSGRSVRWPGASSEDDSDSQCSAKEQVVRGHASTISDAATSDAGMSLRRVARGTAHEPGHSSYYCQPKKVSFHNASAAAKKTKKGMATTKQRLSKKLKLTQLAHS